MLDFLYIYIYWIRGCESLVTPWLIEVRLSEVRSPFELGGPHFGRTRVFPSHQNTSPKLEASRIEDVSWLVVWGNPKMSMRNPKMSTGNPKMFGESQDVNGESHDVKLVISDPPTKICSWYQLVIFTRSHWTVINFDRMKMVLQNPLCK